MNIPKNWVAVASAEHVRIGRSQGFMQVCHGKATPLRRITPGDRVIYYSPTEVFHGKDRLQAFTAFGIVKPGALYQADMGGGFCPFRRDVQWAEAIEAPIRPLLGRLAFTIGKKSWGYQLRFGLFEITDSDTRMIADAMLSSTRSESPTPHIRDLRAFPFNEGTALGPPAGFASRASIWPGRDRGHLPL
jgi:EVE domain